MVREKLKRELEREALTRLEDAARTPGDFEKVVVWWNRLDENRERKERDHEVGRDHTLLEWKAAKDGVIIPNSRLDVFWREAMKGDFLDIIHNCPYEMHELVEDADISELIQKLPENHKEILYYSAVRLYDCARIAAIRGQSDRNIRKLRTLLVSNLQKRLLEKLEVRAQKGLSMTTTQRAFLAAHKKSALDDSKDG